MADLDLGELLHDELFGLFDAMSAIEMMDPKMDAGMLCNRGARKITSFEQAVAVSTQFLDSQKWFHRLVLFQDGLLPLNDLPPATLLGIIDGTLARLVSWLEGHSLAQTASVLQMGFAQITFCSLGRFSRACTCIGPTPPKIGLSRCSACPFTSYWMLSRICCTSKARARVSWLILRFPCS